MLAGCFGFWMCRQTLARGVLCLLSAEYSSNLRGLARNLSDLTVASSQYDILFCSETFSDLHHVSELLVPSFGHPVLLCQGKMPQAHGMTAYVRDGYGALRQTNFGCGCCEMLGFRVCGVRQNLYVTTVFIATLTLMTRFLIVY